MLACTAAHAGRSDLSWAGVLLDGKDAERYFAGEQPRACQKIEQTRTAGSRNDTLPSRILLNLGWTMGADELLHHARSQAERAAPPVRAAILLRIARVESVADRPQGRITFARALDEIRRLPATEQESLWTQARIFAAAIAPSLLHEVPEDLTGPPGYWGWVLGKTMLDHGQADAALQLVLREPAEAFSFPFAMNMLHACARQDWLQDQQVPVMRRAVAAWRETKARDFVQLFGAYWTVLGETKSTEVLREVVQWTLNGPDWPMQGSFDQGRLLFTSGRAYTLLELLHLLRRLDSDLAETLIDAHAELAAGAQRYPAGRDSMRDEARHEHLRRHAKSIDAGDGQRTSESGLPEDLLLQFAVKKGDWERALAIAGDAFEKDTDPEAPNRAPKVLWPSAAKYRTVLFHAGKVLGSAGQTLLPRIVDPDLRLLAEVEFAAALAGLPPMHEHSQRQNAAQHTRHRDRPRRAAQASGSAMVVEGAPVRCPSCQWQPGTGNVWGCRCGHVWNTFTSRGRCPACSYQWTRTMCEQCGKMSPHEDWYGPKETSGAG